MKIAAFGASLLGAAALPGEPLGVGVLLVAIVVAACVAIAARRTFDTILFGALALALAALPALRDATWVVALDLAAACLLASVAVSGPSPVAPFAPYFRLRDLGAFVPRRPRAGAPAVRGALLGSVLLTPFGALFLTADAAFAELVSDIPAPSIDTIPGRLIAFVLIFAIAAGLALAARRPIRYTTPPIPRRLSRWEWALPLALLDALFLAFVAVQITVLFGGHAHVLQTAGLTYAEYAREGFWQLLAASALTLGVVGGFAAFAGAPCRSDRLLRRVLLGVLCGLTFVILVSALRRLQLYEEAFGLTRARLFAEATALWIAGIFGLIVAAGVAVRVRRELARIALAGTALALGTFSLANPDGLIAERNVARWSESGRFDVGYARGLSADAAPALAALPFELRTKTLSDLEARLARDEPWSSFNVSRERARDVLATPGEAD